MKEPYLLSVDIGTSSIRSQVYDATGQAWKGFGAQLSYSMTQTPDGGAFIELDKIYEMVCRVIDQAIGQLKAGQVPIAAVAFCTFWHSVAGVDQQGVPVTPLFSWNDTRPETIIHDLQKKLSPGEFTHRTGCPMHASYLPAKITWFSRAEPTLFKQVRYWMSVGEYVIFKLTGQRVCTLSMASASGLLHSSTCEWDQTTLDALPIESSHLSTLCDASDGMTEIRASFIRRWPALRDAVWYPALGDGACSNIGCGCSTPGRIGVMIGTSGAMRMVWRGDFQPPPQGLWCYRIDRNRPILGGALSNGGNLFQWMYKTLNVGIPGKKESITLPELDRQLLQLPPDGHGLTFLPFLAGQRSPRWNPHSTGTLHGLRLTTQPIELLQAGLEAVIYRFKFIYDRMVELLDKDHVIVATGGGFLKSNAWVQILADVFGRPVYGSNVKEASCRGAALMALESLGILHDVSEADPQLGTVIHPRDDAHTIYQSALQRHRDLEERMIHEADRL